MRGVRGVRKSGVCISPLPASMATVSTTAKGVDEATSTVAKVVVEVASIESRVWPRLRFWRSRARQRPRR